MNRKKICTICLLSAVFIIFTSCSSKPDAVKKEGLEHHIILTYMTLGNKPANSATEDMLKQLNKILTEKVNAELEIYYIPWNDYLTNYDLKLAEMDGSVDLIGTATDWLDAWKNTKLGTFLPIPDDMLKKYAPETWKSVSKEHWDMCRMDGKIYLIPEDNYVQWVNHGFMYRGDWAKEAGLNGVHSWEDLTKYFSYVRSAKPGVIPWDSNAAENSYHGDGYIQSKSDYVPLDGISTLNMFGVRRGNLKKLYSPFYEGDELIAYARLMKKWDQMGVWQKNVLQSTAGNNDNRDEFYKGKSSIEEHHTQTWYTQVRPEMDRRQPGSDCNLFWFGEELGNITTMTITHGAMAISAACKYPERALMVYDLLRNDKECYNLINYGIEGRQYVLTDNGYRKKPDSYTAQKDTLTTNFWWGRNDKLEIRDANSDWKKFDEISATYNKTKIDYPYSQLVWNLGDISKELGNISDVWGIYMAHISYGKMDNPEVYVAEFRDALKKAGIETVIANLQKQLDDFNSQKK
jgi:putative aldouronate transport system substrate-binding protein